jgi:hypothetical protein
MDVFAREPCNWFADVHDTFAVFLARMSVVRFIMQSTCKAVLGSV